LSATTEHIDAAARNLHPPDPRDERTMQPEERMQVYLNGNYIPHSQATVPVDDRGFLFADGVYEVVRIYDGRLFLMEPHMQRLRAGLAALRIRNADIENLSAVAERLIETNAVTADGTLYIQVTRGAAPRKHAFPDADTKPTVYAIAKPFNNHQAEYFSRGVAGITVPDTRWTRCDIKSVSLLANVLANQAAHEAGAFEALFVKDGVVIEGSHSNLFAVLDGRLITYPASNYILTGITRNLVLQLARELGIDAAEAPLHADRIADVTELFLSGTTTEVMPVTRLDGQAVGSGSVGEVTGRLQEAFREYVAKTVSQPMAEAESTA
jgi:D-alanine transaminase